MVIAENTFLNNLELYLYACAAKLAGYITYVVRDQDALLLVIENFLHFLAFEPGKQA